MCVLLTRISTFTCLCLPYLYLPASTYIYQCYIYLHSQDIKVNPAADSDMIQVFQEDIFALSERSKEKNLAYNLIIWMSYLNYFRYVIVDSYGR